MWFYSSSDILYMSTLSTMSLGFTQFLVCLISSYDKWFHKHSSLLIHTYLNVRRYWWISCRDTWKIVELEKILQVEINVGLTRNK